MSSNYCGNNLLKNPERRVSRLACLKKGIGIGKNLPTDGLPYQQMNAPRKYYCGDKSVLPPNYVDFGTNSECLSKGVGIGMTLSNRSPFVATGWNDELMVFAAMMTLAFMFV